jgi:formylglycine-generating enzyme required for sulfatase activity
MSGNVWEWTNSKYDTQNYVCRGGGWNRNQSRCRIAARSGDNPSEKFDNVGFRLVLEP